MSDNLHQLLINRRVRWQVDVPAHVLQDVTKRVPIAPLLRRSVSSLERELKVIELDNKIIKHIKAGAFIVKKDRRSQAFYKKFVRFEMLKK